MSISEHGIEKYARLIRPNVEQVRHLAALVERAPDLELLAPVPFNIVCFRYLVPSLSGDALDALNEELLVRLHESGVAVTSNATLRGRFGLRVAIVNHRSRREDFEVLVREVVRLGTESASEATERSAA